MTSARYSPGGPVILVQYDAEWPAEFAREATAIRAALVDLEIELHHIGSTAVGGLSAKPVIDILLIVSSLAVLDTSADRLVRLGYEGRGEFGVPGRRFFQKTRDDGVRTHQIHAYAAGDGAIRRHLDFRDFLKTHQIVADAYGRLKAELAERHGHDVEAYAEGKTTFVREVERIAAEWRLIALG